MRSVAVTMSMALTACGTPLILPPRTAPAQQMPNVMLPPGPPLPGYGRVVIDGTDGPMNVVAEPMQRFTGGAPTPMASGPLCRTPCGADIPFGQYNLYFSGLAGDDSRGDVAQINVGEGLTVLRRAPGMYKTPPYLQVAPIALVLFGTIVASVGGSLMATNPDQPAVGGALLAGGIGLMIGGAATAQFRAEQQAGTSTTWSQPLTASLPASGTVPPQQPAIPTQGDAP